MERLLDYFIPEHYSLNLDLNKHTKKAKGEVVITGSPKQSIIKLHSIGLTIDRVKIDGKIIKYQQTKDTIELIDPLFLKREDSSLEHIEITINYHFDLRANMEGAYLSHYTYKDQTEWIITTQFESHYARQCFPCVDEPAAKATFDLSLTIPDEDDTVVSNMPVKNAVNSTTGKTVSFQTTPRMSTYLLAFCIGKFHSKSTKTHHGVKITSYCALNQPSSSLDFANQVAAKSLDFYDKEFGVQYPLKKLDQVALPDFEAGAMENWGLVTYRESCMLVDKHTNIDTKHYVATVIAHELSHQWFGNLVTMQWWDDLWLNESFASVMEYIAVDAIHPEFNIWEDFFTGDCLAALKRDALPGVQAVKQPVKDPAEIATLFDGAIVYAKGARLMFMLIRLMGREQFFAGIKDYFKKHAYHNTSSDDLWAALQPHAKFDVKDFMDAWISQPGYPVLTDDDQQRFLLTGATDDTKWPLPTITDDMSGHYLINLSGEEFKKALKTFPKLFLEQRLRLLIDRMLLARTPLVSSASLVDLLPEFKHESSDAVWSIIAGIVGDLEIFFPNEQKEFKDYQRYIAKLVKPQLKKLGIKPKFTEDSSRTKLRRTILALMVFAEDDTTLSELAKFYNDDYTRIPADIRTAVLKASLKNNEEIFSQLVEKYQTTSDPDAKDDMLFVITATKTHSRKALELLDEPHIVRPQNHLQLFVYLLKHHHFSAIDWLYKNWTKLEKLVGEKSIEDYPRALARFIRTKEQSKEFDEFFGPKINNPALSRTIKVAQADIAARLRLIQMDQKDVAAKISKKSQEKPLPNH